MLEWVVGDLAITARPRPTFFALWLSPVDLRGDFYQTFFKADALNTITDRVDIAFTKNIFQPQLERDPCPSDAAIISTCDSIAQAPSGTPRPRSCVPRILLV